MILAVIVSYNPDEEKLTKNINAIISQVDRLVIVDNGSKNIIAVRNIAKECNVELIEFGENLGIAAALQKGLELCKNDGFDYFVTLDQDSCASQNMVGSLKEGFLQDEKIAMIGPKIVDVNLDVFPEVKNRYDYVNDIITSGAIYDVKKILDCGGFNVEMFIDAVDFELCFRLKRAGYSCVRDNNILLKHELGKFTKKKFLFKTVYTTNHSAFRLYYVSRNYLYCIKEFEDLNLPEINKLKQFLKKLPLKIFMVENDKRAKLKAIRKGKKDAKTFSTKLAINANRSK